MSNSVIECDFATFDLSKRSLITQRIKNICPTEAQIEEYFKILDSSMASVNGDFVLLSMGSGIKFDSTKTIIHFFKGIRKIERKYINEYKKAFIVGISLKNKLLLPLYNIFARPIAPRVYVATEEEGIDLASLEMGIPYY